MKREASSWGLYIIGYIIAEVACFRVELRAERYVAVGGRVVLKCDYSVPREQLHKVEWFSGTRKIFQYVKGRRPPYRNFTTPGATIDWSHTDENQLVLKELQFEASGLYSCEVSTNTPIYTKPSDDQEVIVMQVQQEDPKISLRKSEYTVGETLQVNCTSGPARPTPDVTWFINTRQAKESMIRTLDGGRPNCVTVQLTMTIEKEQVGELDLLCLSTIPAYLGHHFRHFHYADHRNNSVKIDVVAQVPEPIPSSSLGVKNVVLFLIPVTCFSVSTLRFVN